MRERLARTLEGACAFLDNHTPPWPWLMGWLRCPNGWLARAAFWCYGESAEPRCQLCDKPARADSSYCGPRCFVDGELWPNPTVQDYDRAATMFGPSGRFGTHVCDSSCAHTIDVGYVHVLAEGGGACRTDCPHPDHRPT